MHAKYEYLKIAIFSGCKNYSNCENNYDYEMC